MNRIHILSLSWNAVDKIDKLAENLSKSVREDWRWYVRDNGSIDNTYDKLCFWQNNIDVIPYLIDHNRDNFSKGVNYLFDKACPNDNDYILLLNNDIIFDNFDDAIAEMLKYMKPDVGIVGCRLLYPNSNKLQHAGVVFSKRWNDLPNNFRAGEQNDTQSEKNRYFQAVTAACCLINAKDFKTVGGMDEKFVWCFEDIDINLSIGNLGKKIVYCGKTKIYHEESATLKKNPVNKMFISKNVATFKKKWAGKYELDYEKYINNKNYNEISG